MREQSVLRWKQPRQGLRLGFELPKRSKVTGQRETSEKAEGTVPSRQHCLGLALLILPPPLPRLPPVPLASAFGQVEAAEAGSPSL